MSMRPTLLVAVAVGLCAASGALAQTAGPVERFQALMGLARLKRDGGDPAAARRYFEQARQIRPFTAQEHAEYFWSLAGYDPPAALEAGREVLAANPDAADVRDRAITEAIRLGDERTVVLLAEEGRRRQPQGALWPRRLGESYLRQGRADQAANAFASAAQARDASVEDRRGLALALESAGRYTEAVSAWDGVPETARAGREEWERSRLRAVALGGTASVAAGTLEEWLARHPGDDDARELLVDVWLRAGDPARALGALPPLAPALEARWIRRHADLGRAAGLHDHALAAADMLAAQGERGDAWTLAELLVTTAHYARAERILRSLAPTKPGCDSRWLRLAENVPGESGASLLLSAVSSTACTDPSWMLRTAERAVAAGRHSDALNLIEALPPETARALHVRRLEGQLRLWTGDAPGAIPILEDVIRSAPGDRPGREALIDAYRANHRPAMAWKAAEPIAYDTALSSDRRLALASLALEADRPVDALALVERLPDGADVNAATLRGRSLLAMGRPAAAHDVLSALAPLDLSPEGALALVDATHEMSGAEAALSTAALFPASTPEWRDVLARRVVLEAVAGIPSRAADLRRPLADLDPDAIVIVDAEIALGRRRPHDALARLAGLPPGARTHRSIDLEQVARAGTGDLQGALELVLHLRRERPDSLGLRIREAELRYRLDPITTTLAGLVELAYTTGNPSAALLAARMLLEARRYADVLALLGPEERWMSLPLEARLVAARALHALTRSSEALSLLSDVPGSFATGAELRAELIAVVEGPGKAAPAFADAAARDTATPQLFLKWAEITPSPSSRIEILERGARRLPGDVAILTRLAHAYWAGGHPADARAAALEAVALDPYAGEAWFLLVDLAAADSPAALDSVIAHFVQATTGRPALVIGLAERLAAFVRPGDDPLVSQATSLLATVEPADGGMALSRDLALARVLSAAERWSESLAAVDSALALDARSPEALRLRAELLSWSGRHLAALEAYNSYLAVQPRDVRARRQQARVAGWAGRFGHARLLYEGLLNAYPADAAIAAEATAKQAYFEGRWSLAAEAYSRWISLEPDNGEARFERAEALRAAGHVAAAHAALVSLDATTSHRLAAVALDRLRQSRQPAVAVVAGRRTSNGYGGRRLLDLDEFGGRLRWPIGSVGRTILAIEGERVSASATQQRRAGYRASVSVGMPVNSKLDLGGHVGLWDLSERGRVSQMQLSGSWRVSDRWTLTGGSVRAPVLENLVTVDERLAATGGFIQGAFESPSTTFEARAVREGLSDGNLRQRATFSVSQMLTERLRPVRLVGWTELLGYRARSAGYFAPRHQLRADAGLEYTRQFSTPRFRGDRQRWVSVGYLLGTDDEGTTYHHPLVHATMEFANGLALEARGDWIRSRVYRETSIFVGLRIAAATRPTR
jgi:tetratricopeptide (TPR) repeat protein